MRKLAGPLTSTAAVTPSAEATVTRNPSGNFHLRLITRVGSQVGERTIDGKSCNSLAGATAIAVVLMLRSANPLDEGDLAAAPPASPSDASREKSEGAGRLPTSANRDNQEIARGTKPATREPTEQPSDAPEPHRRWHVLLQLPQAALGVGPLREPSLGGAISGGLGLDRWRFLARGTVWLPQHVSATSDQGGESFGFTGTQTYGADIRRTTGSLLACRALWLSRFEVAPCLKVSLEHLSARGTGTHIAARTDGATWLAGGLGLHARAFLAPWLSFVLGIEGELESSTPQLSLAGVRNFEKQLPAAGTVTVGAEWIL
ncbi:MAG: hypothetical protein ABIQ16_17010 [Polyangiaceae bacterium]